MSYYDSLEGKYIGEVIRKDMLHSRYASDPYMEISIERNKNGIRRIIFNLLVKHVVNNYAGILADMLFIAYRMGINDGRSKDLH